MQQDNLRLSSVLADVFKPVWVAAKHHQYTHFWLKGGRGSTKSSFISLAIMLLLSKNPNVEALIFRKVADTLKSSVFEQMLWAADMFRMNDKIHKTIHPLQITLNTGQRIMFRGLDEPGKIKSIKSAKRYFGIGWYEELDEFGGMEEIRKVNQSIMRGEFPFWLFYSYNPPVNKNNWVNQEAEVTRPGKLIHHSTYLDVPPQWLGQPFIQEAEITKATKPRVYRHEYLGEVTGTGGIIFPNVKNEPMSNARIKEFDNIRQGIDWGYMTDPFVYIKLHYDKKHRSIYVYDEVYKHGLSNIKASELIKQKEFKARAIIADSSEPKSIAEMKSYGHNVKGAEKGQGSVEYGIKFLQALDAIYIDKNRCPNAYREFSNYELEKDKNGEFKQEPPDRDNHCLVGNTKVITDKGDKYIRNIKAGDKVLTTAGYKEVEWSGVSDTNRQVYKVMTDNGKYIVGTNNHKVFTLRGFVRIDKLKTGDIVLTKEGTECQNASVKTIKCIGKAKKVYDLTVKDKHEFFANGILVHNCIDSARYAMEGDMKRYAW